MKKNIWIVVLLGVVAVLAIVVVQQNRRAAQVNEQLAAATEELAQTPPAPAPQQAPAEQPREELPVAPVPAPGSPSNSGASSGTASNFLSGLAGMMKDPAMKEMIRAQQKMGLDRMYGSLTKYLDLPADKLEALKELLADRQMELTEAGMALMSGTDADRKQAAATAKTIKEDYDKEIQTLLGAQDYETFKEYELTVGERMQVQMFKDALSSDAALSEEQEDGLIVAMYEARKTLPPSSLVNNQNPPDPSQLTEAHIAEALKQLEQMQQSYADRAATILSPVQLEQFTKWQQQLAAMQSMGLKMAAKMFGSQGGAPATSQ